MDNLKSYAHAAQARDAERDAKDAERAVKM